MNKRRKYGDVFKVLWQCGALLREDSWDGWCWRFNSRDCGRRVWRGRRCNDPSQSWSTHLRQLWLPSLLFQL